MSLELALQENTSALHTLIALIEKGGVLVASAAEVKANKVATSKPVAEKPADTPVAEVTKTAEVEVAVASLSEDVKPVTYEDAKAAVTSVVKAKGRDAGLAVLAKFGAESLLAVPADQWADVIAACGEALK